MNRIELKKRQIEMLSQILELIVLMVLGKLLGDSGIAYFAVAAAAFLLLWTVTGMKVADTLGRILRGKTNKGQYKNATRMRQNVLIIEGVIGLAGSAVLFAAATLLCVELLQVPYSVAVTWILAPVVLVRTMSAVMLGFFQGEGTQLPSVITYILRPCCTLVFSFVFVRILKGYGSKVSALLKQELFTAMYGAIGVALAVFVSELFLLVFLILVYRRNRPQKIKGVGEGMRTTDTFSRHAAVLYGNLFPQILKMFLLLLPFWLGLLFFRKSVPGEDGLVVYGVFWGKAVPLMGIVTLPGIILLLDCAGKVSACYRREEQRYARGHFSGGLHMSMVYGMFASVLMAVLAPRISGVFSETETELMVQMLRWGAFFVLILIMAFYFTEILGAIGGKYHVLGLLAGCDLIYAVSLVLFLNKGNAGVMALLYSGLPAGVVYVLGTAVLVVRQLRYHMDWMQSIAIPAGASCAVGLIILFLAKVIYPYLGDMVTVVVAFIIANFVYWILLMVMRNFREQELTYTPCGGIIRMIGQMFRVY